MTQPTDEEIKAVIGDLPPQASGKALAAHLGIDTQAAHDLLDGYWTRDMRRWLTARRRLREDVDARS